MKRKTEIGNQLWYVLVALIVSVISIIVFVTGKNLPQLLNDPTAVIESPARVITIIVSPTFRPTSNNQLPMQTQLVSTATIAPTVTIAPTHTKNPESWSGLLDIRLPTLNEIRAEVPMSIWDANYLTVSDIPAPGSARYNGEVLYTNEYLFPVYWCATSPKILAHAMENIQTAFLVNQEVIPDKYVFQFNYDTDTGWNCAYHAIVLGGWTRNASYTLQIKHTLLTELTDGEGIYAPGDYIYELVVNVR